MIITFVVQGTIPYEHIEGGWKSSTHHKRGISDANSHMSTYFSNRPSTINKNGGRRGGEGLGSDKSLKRLHQRIVNIESNMLSNK